MPTKKPAAAQPEAPATIPQILNPLDSAVKRIQDFHGTLDARIECSIDLHFDTGFVLAKAKVFMSGEDQAKGLPKGVGHSAGRLEDRCNSVQQHEQIAVSNALANAGYAYQHYETQESQQLNSARLEAPETALPMPPALSPRLARKERAREAALTLAPEPDTMQPAEEYDPPALGVGSQCNQCTNQLDAKQTRESLLNFGVVLCPSHQREAKERINANG